MKVLHVVILAAGGGTRMKSELPKVLHPMCGRPMIAYALDLAAATGVKQPVVVLGESADQIAPHLPKEAKVVIQRKPLGTGDAVVAAKRSLGGLTGDTLILYADTPLLRRTTIQRLIEAHHKSGATCTFLTTHLADPTGYGRILREPSGTISSIVEEADATATQRAIREVNAGPLCINTQLLFEALASVQPSGVKKEWHLTKAVAILAKRDGTKFQAVRVDEATEAMGVNSRLDLARTSGIIRQRIIEGHLNNGVMIVEPHATFIDHGVSIGQDTVIYPGTVIESGVHIGRRCSVGPFARLRRGVTLADEVRVGNFVELVRTKVGTRVRINHVAYLGDTTIEEDVNIGAGTITANFDGEKKLPTTIGKGAFVGCDTILVAPVKVGPGAVTGAGSVIPKGHDVPPGGVVVGVPAHPFEGRAAKSGLPSSLDDGAKPAAVSRRPVAGRTPLARRPAAKPSPKRPLKKAAPKAARRRAKPKARRGVARRRAVVPRRRAVSSKRRATAKRMRRVGASR